MEIRGTVLQVQENGKGTSAKGDWVKHLVIVEYGDQYPKKVALTLFNKAKLVEKLLVGCTATFDCNPESREYNGKWFTDLSCWKVNDIQGGSAPAPQAQPSTAEEGTGLPF